MLKKKKQSYLYWLKKNWYFHNHIANFYKAHIFPHARVLHIGSKSGNLLHALNPAYGIGIEWENSCLQEAQEQFPQYTFYKSLQALSPQQFDFIIISSAIHELDDIQEYFSQLAQYCHERTRIIIDIYSFLWEPVLWLTQKLGLRRPTKIKNWITLHDLNNFLYLAGFETITTGSMLLIPCYIPLVSWLINTFIAQLPIIRKLDLIQWVIAKKLITTTSNPSVSIIIPCKNERGNVQAAIKRCPQFGSSMEFIFIEGHSHDGTLEEMARVKNVYPEKAIRYYVQKGKGKADAVLLAFQKAQGEVLMILDGDLTMPPEELPKFFDALVHNRGECINGSRLVYGMESDAMRFLNTIANYLFSLGFSWLLGQRIKDTLCGTKVLYKKDYESIVQHYGYLSQLDPFGDFFLLFGSAKINLKIIDVPVHYKRRTYGTSQIRRFYCGLLLIKMYWKGLWIFKFRS